MELPFLLEEICGFVDRSWEYINRSPIHECRNWGWGRAIPRKGIYKRNCLCSEEREGPSIRGQHARTALLLVLKYLLLVLLQWYTLWVREIKRYNKSLGPDFIGAAITEGQTDEIWQLGLYKRGSSLGLARWPHSNREIIITASLRHGKGKVFFTKGPAD
jgi:hypothetical protein